MRKGVDCDYTIETESFHPNNPTFSLGKHYEDCRYPAKWVITDGMGKRKNVCGMHYRSAKKTARLTGHDLKEKPIEEIKSKKEGEKHG
jgi:hypothetical protein